MGEILAERFSLLSRNPVCPNDYIAPVCNRALWSDQILSKMARDIETMQAISAAVRLVLRFWEHENAPNICGRLVKCVRQRQRTWSPS